MVILFDNHSILKIFLLIVKQCSSFLAKLINGIAGTECATNVIGEF